MNQMETNQILIALIQCFLAGKRWEEPLVPEQKRAVLSLAAKHDVAHLVAVVLERSDEIGKEDAFFVEKRKAVYRYVQQDYERGRIYNLFEQEGIPFIPLKGSVIGALYPEHWQRTGCDIDILVQQRDLERAESALSQKLGFCFRKRSAHDVSLYSPTGVHLELHYSFDEEIVVDEVWATSVPLQCGCMQRSMTGELFVLHHIAHMAKHFCSGGCGLRPFVDLWYVRQKLPYDATVLAKRLEKCGLKRFAEVVFGLLDMWFADGMRSPVLAAAENYILPAGAYGSLKNHVAIGQIKKGSKTRYFMSRFFQSRELLEYPYPMLKKHGWLLPFCQVHRWYKLLADGKLKRITDELGANSATETEFRDHVEELLEELQLKH